MAGGKAVERAAEGVIAKALKDSVRDAEEVVARDAAKDTAGSAARDAGKDTAHDLDDVLGRTFDNEHPGPLSPSEASTFTGRALHRRPHRGDPHLLPGRRPGRAARSRTWASTGPIRGPNRSRRCGATRR